MSGSVMTAGKRYNNKVVQRLGSLKLSFFLMICLAFLVMQRAIIAQKAVLPRDGQGVPLLLKILNALGLTSPGNLDRLFLGLLVIFALNLAFSSLLMVRRIRAKQRGFRGYRTPEEIRFLANCAELRLPGGSRSRIVNALEEDGFRVSWEQGDKKTVLFAGKRDAGRWGVFFFHLTFFIVLVGALMSYLTRFSGYLELSPGQVFVEEHENYLRTSHRPILFNGDRRFRIELEEIDLSYWKPGVVKQRAGIVKLFNDQGAFLGKRRVEVNSPLKIGGMSIYQGTHHGYIAGLEVTDSEGAKATGTARFRIPEKPGQGMTSRVSLPGTGLDLDLELFTEKLGEIQGLEQFKTKHMATLMKVTSVEGPRRVFRGILFGGGGLSFEGLTLTFGTLKPYTSLVAVQDYGVPVIFAGLVFLLIGLVVIYFWVPENYWAVIQEADGEDRLVIGAVTEKYKGSFTERFASRIREFKSGTGLS